MLYEVFLNNGQVSLADELAADAVTISLNEVLSETVFGVSTPLFGTSFVNDSTFARATISSPDVDGFEIVFITEVDTETNRMTIVRAAENTTAIDWPAGSTIQSRVTAGMLFDLKAGALFDASTGSLSLAYANNSKAYDWHGNTAMPINSWSIGGCPVLAEMGGSDRGAYRPMSASVEGVGTSDSVELGVAPGYDSEQEYFAGSIVRDPNPPHAVFAHGNNVVLSDPKPALGEAFWQELYPSADGDIYRASFLGWDDPDVRFYPSEIGFICDQYSAATPPKVSIGSIDDSGEPVSFNDLVNGFELNSVDGAHQRAVIAGLLKQGVRGLVFTIHTAATGGSFKGRFYWKGLFICSNSAAGWPTQYGSPDGQ